MSGEVVLYQRTDGLLYVSSFSRNRQGWLVVNGWYRAVPAEAPDNEVGTAVQDGLGVEEGPVDIPADQSEDLLKPLLAAAGAKSYTAFGRDARAVGVSQDDVGGHIVTPMRNPNRRRGNSFLHLVESELIVPPGASAGDLGAAVREGLSRSIVE